MPRGMLGRRIEVAEDRSKSGKQKVTDDPEADPSSGDKKKGGAAKPTKTENPNSPLYPEGPRVVPSAW